MTGPIDSRVQRLIALSREVQAWKSRHPDHPQGKHWEQEEGRLAAEISGALLKPGEVAVRREVIQEMIEDCPVCDGLNIAEGDYVLGAPPCPGCAELRALLTQPATDAGATERGEDGK